jgi:DNA-binding transcriptional LysR family regulator
MINIPTELLRTLVAVVDLRSFTRAAQSMGITQPAVSAQIKRLQLLLDVEIFDKSAPGVSLTPSGRLLVNYARRLLCINDQIVDISMPKLATQTLRVGVPGDFVGPVLPPVLRDFRAHHPDIRFSVRTAHFDILARDLRQGDIDLLIGLSETGIMLDARHQWTEPMVWVRNPGLTLDADSTVPLVTHGDACANHRAMVAALNKARRAYEIVFTSPSAASVVAAVACGFGVTALPRSRLDGTGLAAWEDAPLPPVADLFCGLYLSEQGDQPVLERLAAALFVLLGPKPAPADPASPAGDAALRV